MFGEIPYIAFILGLFIQLSYTSPGTRPMEDSDIIRACNSSSPMSSNDIDALFATKDLGENRSRQKKCFLACIYKKYGFMNEDGAIDEKNIRNYLSEQSLDERTVGILASECSRKVSQGDDDDECERAYRFTNCYWSRSKDLKTKG